MPATIPGSRPFLSRFWSKVSTQEAAQCWLWTGCCSIKHAGTYGQFHLKRPRAMVAAHRLAWVLSNAEPVPPQRFVLHHCDNPLCVNPGHLFIGDHSDNMRDMARKGRGRNQWGKFTARPGSGP